MVIKEAQEVLRIEAEGILGLIDRIGQEFLDAVDLIYASKGRVIVTGIGKSGIVGRKIVATLNSTGTPALFLHPVEALHGDLGMVTSGDILIAISYSGETEVNDLIPIVRSLGASVIAFTGDLESGLADQADLVLDVGVAREACPLGLAPTASTTAATAMAMPWPWRLSIGVSSIRMISSVFTPAVIWGSVSRSWSRRLWLRAIAFQKSTANP